MFKDNYIIEINRSYSKIFLSCQFIKGWTVPFLLRGWITHKLQYNYHMACNANGIEAIILKQFEECHSGQEFNLRYNMS